MSSRRRGVIRAQPSPISARKKERPAESVRAGHALLVVVHGDEAGKRVELGEDAIVIGRAPRAKVRLTDRTVAEKHARVTREHGHWVVHEEPGASVFVNDQRVAEYVLRDGDRIRVGRTILKLLATGNLDTRYEEEVFRVSHLDGLTLATNQHAFEAMLERDVSRARRFGQALSVVLLDVDGFSRLNREQGEAVGSAVLQRLALHLRHHLRRQDVLARIGDDEFAVILPETEAAEAARVAEKLRRTVEVAELPTPDGSVRVTVSGGVATLEGGEHADVLADRAWKALTAARKAGGNSVEQRQAMPTPKGRGGAGVGRRA